MATILQVLRGITLYPLPEPTLIEIATRRGVELTDEATQSVMSGSAYKLAKADLLMWLSLAPQVTQGGQSYQFTDEQRTQFRNRANALYAEAGENDSETSTVVYGFKGTRL